VGIARPDGPVRALVRIPTLPPHLGRAVTALTDTHGAEHHPPASTPVGHEAGGEVTGDGHGAHVPNLARGKVPSESADAV
jgi:hypothetical protein